MRRRLLSTGALVALAFFSSSAFEACRPRKGPGGPNFILISVDTLRADHLGCYGYWRDTSPTLDRLAQKGVLFEQVVANAPWTLPSHTSLLTGLYPHHHGIKSHSKRLRDDIPTLASVFRAAGYATLGLVNSHNLSARYGLERGFDTHHYYPERVNDRRVRSAKVEVDETIAWLDRVSPHQSFFVFIHNYDVHSDYDPSPPFAKMFARPYEGTFNPTSDALERVRQDELTLSDADVQHTIDLYDGGIRQADADLGRLVEHLDRSGIAATTYVILTSDHGEEFLEHGGVAHGRTMYHEVLSVPLLVRGPGVPANRRVRGLVQLTDVFPTILSLARLPAPRKVDGIDLVPTWAGARPLDPGRYAYGEADHRNAQPDIKRMVRRGHEKLIYNRAEQSAALYDLAQDPGEHHDLATADPATTGRLLAALRQYMVIDADGIPLPPLSEKDKANLRSLGYVQ
jgi:arylsulfatase A-like enzyme